MITEIRRFLGLETDHEKLERYEDITKSFSEVSNQIDELAKDFFIEKSLYAQRMQDPDNYTIQGRIQDKFDGFLTLHKDNIRKAKKSYDSLKKEKEVLEKAIGEKLAQLNMKKGYDKIKKSYQDGKISLDMFNIIIKGITKDSIVKYADMILFNQEGEILLLKRSSWEDRNNGSWCIPGGHVDPGESFVDASVRELQEESGFSVVAPAHVGTHKDSKVHIEYFQAIIDTNEQSHVLQWEEVRDYKWVRPEDLQDYPMIFNMYDNIVEILGLQKVEKTEIRKAIELGIISEDMIEKATKDTSKLVKKKKLVTRGTSTFLMTVWVNPTTGAETTIDEKEIDYHPIVKDIMVGDTFYGRTPKISGEFTLDSICLDKGTDPYLVFTVGGKPKTIMVKALTDFVKTESASTGEPVIPPTKIDVSLSDLTDERLLGGSSGVRLMSGPDGELYAVKKPHKGDENQLKQEATMSQLYRSLGFLSSESEFKDGVLISKFIQGAKELNSVSATVTLKQELRKGYVLDCLLGNWDVLGSNEDNVLVKEGKVYRIDNGGCMRFRAKGGDKSFPPSVDEIDTLRTYEPGNKWFSGITDDEIRSQIADLRKNFSKFNIVKGLANGTHDHTLIEKRLSWLEAKYGLSATAAKTTATPAPPKEVLRPDMPSLVTQRYFDSLEWKNLNMAGNKGIKEHIKDRIIYFENRNKREFDSIASSEGISVEEVKANMLKWTKGIIAKSKGYIVAHSTGGYKGYDVVGKIISEGRFKSQFEVGKSCGSLAPSSRAAAEDDYFGFPRSTTADKDQRPIYGFFTDHDHGAINSSGTVPPPREVNQYGDICFEVKDEKFRKDATITFRDSLGIHDECAAVPAGAPHFSAVLRPSNSYHHLKKMYEGKVSSSLGGYSYVETQYHGQLKLVDIKKIHISVDTYGRSELSNVINEVNDATLKGGMHIPVEMF